MQNRPLQHLDYFAEWGAKAWQRLPAFAIREFLGEDLRGLEALEIGSRYGKMSALCALLGARVIGVDVIPAYAEIARAEAQRLGVAERTEFLTYRGDLAVLGGRAFDIVLTKSVLVVVPDLERSLRQVRQLLRPGGRFAFLENAHGSFLLHSLRALKHRKWNFRTARYFTEREVAVIRDVFPSARVKKVRIPPVWLVYGEG